MGFKDSYKIWHQEQVNWADQYDKAKVELELHEAVFGMDEKYKIMWEDFHRTYVVLYLGAKRPWEKQD